MENFFSSSNKGVVLFSLGSNFRSEHMTTRKQKLFIDVFSEFQDYNFLWKFESNITAAELPKNIQIRSWLPQSDILAHPKLKALITHNGLLSTHEAIWRGVPIIGMPFGMDQNKVKQIYHFVVENLFLNKFFCDIFRIWPEQSYWDSLKV